MTRPCNSELRTREYLTQAEIETIMAAAKKNRYGLRDSTMILIVFRHGLRAAEACDLQWDQVDFNAAVLHVRRIKGGSPSTQPLAGDELRALRALRRQDKATRFVFNTERKAPFTPGGFAKMVVRTATRAKLDIKAHAHMLRHGCGFALANKGVDTRTIQAYLGHRSIQHTCRYTELAPGRFKDIWS